MKEFKVLLVLVLVTVFAFACKAKAPPVIREVGFPTSEKEVAKESPEATPLEKAAPALEQEPAISKEIQQLLDEVETLGWDAKGKYFYVEVIEGFWYQEWIDNFHSAIRTLTDEDTCFSNVPEAEGEAVFWAAVHQIPKDTHPDTYSGRLNIPRNCDEAREWANTIFSALKKSEEDSWCDPKKGCWINTLPKRLAANPEYDPR